MIESERLVLDARPAAQEPMSTTGENWREKERQRDRWTQIQTTLG